MWDQAYVISGWVVCALALVLGAWALFGDWIRQRFNKRKRCPRCWYDMSRSPTLTCSECGCTAKKERRLFRARRRWRWAFVALLLLIGSNALHVTPRVKQRGWVAAVPTTVLIFAAPMNESAWGTTEWGDIPIPDHRWLIELEHRCSEQKLSAWQWRVVFGRYFRALPSQRDEFLRTRSLWPEDTPVEAYIDNPPGFVDYGASRLLIRIRAREIDDSWHQYIPAMDDWLDGVNEYSLSYDKLPDALESLTFDVEVYVGAEVRYVDADFTKQELCLEHLTRVWAGSPQPIRVAGSVDDLLTPYTSHEADESIVSELEPALARFSDGSVDLRLHRTYCHLQGNRDEPDWSLGVKVEVLHDDCVVAIGECLYHMVKPGWDANFGGRWDYSPLDWFIEPPATIEHGSWRIRLTGDPTVAVYDLDRDTYWSGQVTVPVETIFAVEEEGW